MRSLLRLLLLASAFGLGTVSLGWLAVPGIGLLWGLIAAEASRPVATGAAAATLSWALLLGWTAGVGRVSALLTRLAGIFEIPGASLVLLTLIVGAGLAGLAAATGVCVATMYRSSPANPAPPL